MHQCGKDQSWIRRGVVDTESKTDIQKINETRGDPIGGMEYL